jgi:hypothetical protein
MYVYIQINKHLPIEGIMNLGGSGSSPSSTFAGDIGAMTSSFVGVVIGDASLLLTGESSANLSVISSSTLFTALLADDSFLDNSKLSCKPSLLSILFLLPVTLPVVGAEVSGVFPSLAVLGVEGTERLKVLVVGTFPASMSCSKSVTPSSSSSGNSPLD